MQACAHGLFVCCLDTGKGRVPICLQAALPHAKLDGTLPRHSQL